MVTQLFIHLLVAFVLNANPGNVICCHTMADGNLSCTPPGADGCESGDKAVVCRYGYATPDPETNETECLPN